MLREFLLAAYWGKRREGPRECAARVLPILKAIASLSGGESAWRKVPRRRGDRSGQPIENAHDLATEFEAGRFLDDYGDWMETVGYTLAARASTGPKSVLISSTCGGYAGPPPNSVLIGLPRAWVSSLGTGAIGGLVNLFKQVIDSTDPDFAVLNDHRCFSAKHPFVGWLTYLRIPPSSVAELPSPAQWEPYAKGTIICLGNDLPTDTDRPSAGLPAEIEDRLREAGIWEDIDYLDR